MRRLEGMEIWARGRMKMGSEEGFLQTPESVSGPGICIRALGLVWLWGLIELGVRRRFSSDPWGGQTLGMSGRLGLGRAPKFAGV